MKQFTSLAIAVGFGMILHAQTSVPKVPVYEVFSSSTCGPCAPSNAHLSPIFEERINEIVVAKYQVNWPGTGDPYYTSEVNSRRNLYGVNSVPGFFRNTVSTAYSSFTDASIDDDLALESHMKIELRYRVDTATQDVRIRARIEALETYSDGGHRIMIPIIERITYKNKKSNGETEFHNVFKKMLPSSTGELVIGELTAGTVIEIDTSYHFNGNYRLPSSSLDPIDHAIEHSVENFENLHVVMFVQSMTTSKEIYQGAVGENSKSEADFTREWGTDPEPPLGMEIPENGNWVIYPNPVTDVLTVKNGSGDRINGIRVMDSLGRLVMSVEGEDKWYIQVDMSSLPQGFYHLVIDSEAGETAKYFVVE